jgi:hypothetical protein
MLFRRIANIAMNWRLLVAFGAYVFLIFSHPFFYVHYVFDVFSQLAYLFLIAAAWCFTMYYRRRTFLPLFAFVALMLLGFLTKETFGLSALFLAAAWFVFARKENVRVAVIPVIAVGMALGLALLIERALHSPFTSGADQQGGPYQIDLSPIRLAAAWLQYFEAGLHVFSLGALILVIFAAFRSQTTAQHSTHLIVLLLPVAAALAWLPNAVLPNHYYADYSWNGTCLLFAPILLLAPLSLGSRRMRASVVGLLVLVFFSPTLFYNKHQYYRTYNSYTLGVEAQQRNLLRALQPLLDCTLSDPAPERILVTGISFPTSPFSHGFALDQFSHAKNLQLDVVDYVHWEIPAGTVPAVQDGTNGVRFVAPDGVDFAKYQRVWAFNFDGTLARSVSQPTTPGPAIDVGMGFTPTDYLLYPELYKAFPPPQGDTNGRKQPDGDQYLVCGTSLMNYGNLGGASKCLLRSSELTPQSPYPYYFLGQIKEQQGALGPARDLLAKAVSLDSKKSPNIFFGQELNKVDALLSAAKK